LISLASHAPPLAFQTSNLDRNNFQLAAPENNPNQPWQQTWRFGAGADEPRAGDCDAAPDGHTTLTSSTNHTTRHTRAE
jgi:hypothetical protein